MQMPIMAYSVFMAALIAFAAGAVKRDFGQPLISPRTT